MPKAKTSVTKIIALILKLYTGLVDAVGRERANEIMDNIKEKK